MTTRGEVITLWCGNEDVRLDPMIAAVIDRPHVDHVVEIGKRALDF